MLAQLTPQAREYFDQEHGTFQKVTDISGVLKPIPKDQRRAAIATEASKIELPDRQDLYLPVDPRKRLIRILPESGRAMQSAAKTPIMLAFDVEALPLSAAAVEPMGCEQRKQACIFKVGDDCRQDVLALQVGPQFCYSVGFASQLKCSSACWHHGRPSLYAVSRAE